MPLDIRSNMTSPDENPPPYTQDTSPPMYEASIDDDTWADSAFQAHSIHNTTLSYLSSLLSRSERLQASMRQEDRDIELGDINREAERSSSSPTTSRTPVDFATRLRQHYDLIDTGRANVDEARASSASRTPHSSPPHPPTSDAAPTITSPSRPTQAWNHTWESAPSQLPLAYDSIQSSNWLRSPPHTPVLSPPAADPPSPSRPPSAPSPLTATRLTRTGGLRIEAAADIPAPAPAPAPAALPRSTASAHALYAPGVATPRRCRADDQPSCRCCFRVLFGIAFLALLGYGIFELEGKVKSDLGQR